MSRKIWGMWGPLRKTQDLKCGGDGGKIKNHEGFEKKKKSMKREQKSKKTNR